MKILQASRPWNIPKKAQKPREQKDDPSIEICLHCDKPKCTGKCDKLPHV